MVWPLKLDGFNIGESQAAEIARIIEAAVGGDVPALQSLVSGGGNLVKPSNWFATQEFANPVAYTGTGSTFANRRSFALPFTGGRLIAYNAGAVPAADCNRVVGNATSAAVTTQAANFVTPTWGNGKAGPVAAGLFSGTASVNVAEFALSDTFALPSVARGDGGSGYIAELRTYVPNAVDTVYALAPDQGTAIQLLTAGGVAYSGASKAGDFVTTNQAGFSTLGTSTHFIFGDMLLFTDSAVYTVAAGGDSLMRGQYGDEGRQNDIRIACDSLTLAGVANVQFLQHTRPSAGVDSYGPSCINFIRRMRPGIFFYCPSSPNDSGLDVAATLNKSKNWLFAVKQECDAVGTTLVIANQPPWAPFSGTQDNALKAFNAYLSTLATQLGVKYFDRYAATTDGASPASLLPAYQWPTGTANQKAHLNNMAYAALAVPAAAIIRTLIGK